MSRKLPSYAVCSATTVVPRATIAYISIFSSPSLAIDPNYHDRRTTSTATRRKKI
jgi:hypothetical protein